jgi:fatty acid desaturase
MSIPHPKEQVLPNAANALKTCTLLALLLVSFALAQLSSDAIAASGLAPTTKFLARWSAVAVFGIGHVMILIGLGILAHDAVHRVLFRSPFWNDLVGGVLSALSLLPFYSNRQFHLTHHSYAHQPGLDPENEMHERPILLAMTMGSGLALLLQVRVLLRNVLRMNEPERAARVVKDVLLMSFAAAFYSWLMPTLGISIAVSIVPVFVLFPLVFGVRAMSDHYGLPPMQRASRFADVLEDDPESWLALREKRQREVTGWVVLTSPWLAWLWSNVNYHEVHHKYPWLSFRQLPAAFEATRDRHNYRVVQGYWRALWESRKRSYYAES